MSLRISLFSFGLSLAAAACGSTNSVPSDGAGGRALGTGGNTAGGGGIAAPDGGGATPTSIYCFPDRCQPPQQQCCIVSAASSLEGMCVPAEATCPTSYFERCADTSACPGGVCCHGLGASRLETDCTSLATCQAAGRVACTSDTDCVGLGAKSYCCGGPTYGGSCADGACIP